MYKIGFLLIGILLGVESYGQDNESSESNDLPNKSFFITTNIPTWLIGIPSLGIAYQKSEKTEILLGGTFPFWNFKKKDEPRYWRSWSISPQFRKYINTHRDAYVGLQYQVGQYNILDNQGKYMGGGISFGKQYYFAKNMLIDLGLTLGYLRFTDRAKYIHNEDVFYIDQLKKDKNYWGPTSISVKLIKKLN